MHRSRVDTENRLLDAVSELVVTKGLDQIGINRVASHAGINKILIYRYFGGLDGLLKAYYERTKPVPSAAPLDMEAMKNLPLADFFDTCYQYIIEEFRLLRQNPEAQEFMKADLINGNGLSTVMAREKEAALLNMVDELSKLIGTTKGRPFATIVVSAMTLLTVMSQQKRVMLGVDLGTPEGWTEIELALKNIYKGAYLYTRERLAGEQQCAAGLPQDPL